VEEGEKIQTELKDWEKGFLRGGKNPEQTFKG